MLWSCEYFFEFIPQVFSSSMISIAECCWIIALFLQEDSPDCAAKQATATQQPSLFRCQRRLWLKADNTPIEIADAGCFADAIQILVSTFWIFNVEYPYHLKAVYDLLETTLRLKKSLNVSWHESFWDVSSHDWQMTWPMWHFSHKFFRVLGPDFQKILGQT